MSILSFQYYYRIGEAAKIQIHEINNLKDDKLFVNVVGMVKKEVISLTKKFIHLPIVKESAIVKEKSFVCIDGISDLNLTQDRFNRAKENSFTTVLVLIDTPTNIVESAERNLIVQSFQTIIKDNKLVDFYVHVRR